MAYELVNKLQKVVADEVFNPTKDPKKSGRALGTLVEILIYYLLKTWGLNNQIFKDDSKFVEKWFNVISSSKKSLAALRSDFDKLKNKNWKTIFIMSAGRKINTLSQSWGTPHKYAKAVKEVFGGHIDLDPCSNEYSVVKAQTEYRLPIDGLKESWNFPTIYVNPPYGIDKDRGTTIKSWLAKCAYAHDAFNSEVLALVPLATNTAHWKEYVFTKAKSICFLYDTRLRFLENGQDIGKGAPMACAMIYWGSNLHRFYEVFIQHGAVVDISNLIGENIGVDRQKLKLFL